MFIKDSLLLEIETGMRFVNQNQLGPQSQRTRQRNSLGLSTRCFIGKAVNEVAHLKKCDYIIDAFVYIFMSGGRNGKPDVIEKGHVRPKKLSLKDACKLRPRSNITIGVKSVAV